MFRKLQKNNNFRRIYTDEFTVENLEQYAKVTIEAAKLDDAIKQAFNKKKRTV